VPKVTLLGNRAVLYEREESVNLDEFMIGVFDGSETREEIQELAFEATESRVLPYLDRWINIAAIRAMGESEGQGTAFVPVLEEQAQNPWSEQLMGEALQALKRIRGG